MPKRKREAKASMKLLRNQPKDNISYGSIKEEMNEYQRADISHKVQSSKRIIRIFFWNVNGLEDTNIIEFF